MNIDWDDVAVFEAVLAHGSFSAAATALRIGQPTVSRRIARLEAEVGESLFRRQAEGALPTAAAEQLRGAARGMAEWATAFRRSADALTAEPEGDVVITAAPGIAVDVLAPFAAHLRYQHPAIRLDIRAQQDDLDLVRGEADIAIRNRPHSGVGVDTFWTFKSEIGVFAAKSYAERITQPATVEDLDWITWGDANRTLEPRASLEQRISDFTPVMVADEFLVHLAAARAGLGCVFLATALGEAHGLVRVDVDLEPINVEMYFLVAKHLRESARVKAVCVALEGWCSAMLAVSQ